jgi:hypothetical protein
LPPCSRGWSHNEAGLPLRLDAAGRTATTDHARWIRGLLEQLLLTQPRRTGDAAGVRRWRAGAGVRRRRPELAATVRLLVEGAVRGAMADLISLEALDVEPATAC